MKLQKVVLTLMFHVTSSSSFRTTTFVAAPPSMRSRMKPQKITTELHGIRGFRQWFDTQFPTAMSKIPLNHEGAFASEEFDHVLIDVNQLLHVTLRRSRTNEQAFKGLIGELDRLLAMARPQKSLVLAIDGPACAAKLMTQNRRRRAVFDRISMRRDRIAKLQSRGTLHTRRIPKRKKNEKNDILTLQITPGCKFLDEALEVLYYYVWQRLSNTKGGKLNKNVEVWVSSGLVPGEGEVKLLDWCYNSKRLKKDDSVAFLGGDADLVLEGLVVPLQLTKNVFVILPDERTSAFCVSIWEVTRSMYYMVSQLERSTNMRDLQFMKVDLVFLCIMNGNDYLPKLRGSSGFKRLFQSYCKLLESWDSNTLGKPFLVDSDDGNVSFNLAFAVAFFDRIAKYASQINDADLIANNTSSITPLSKLNSIADSGLIPPLSWRAAPDSEDPGLEQIHLVIEDTEQKGGPRYEYTIHHISVDSIKTSKHRLASMALDDLVGPDWRSESDGDGDDFFGEYDDSITVKSDVEAYVRGLLWNLKTYQEGICADYSYTYGRKMSPTAAELANFFRERLQKNKSVCYDEFLSNANHVEPLSAPLSCLATLPVKAAEFIPEPYFQLTKNGLIEEIYADCLKGEAQIFDLEEFRRRCNEEIDETIKRKIKKQKSGESRTSKPVNKSNGRKIPTSDKDWTVFRCRSTNQQMGRSYAPPKSFGDYYPLRQNKYMSVRLHKATNRPKRSRKHHGSIDKTKRVDASRIVDYDYKNAFSDFITEKDITKFTKKLKKNGERNITDGSLGTPHTLTALWIFNDSIGSILEDREWEFISLEANELEGELVRLNVFPCKGHARKTFEMKRGIGTSRQFVKHKLAAQALEWFDVPAWREFKDLIKIEDSNSLKSHKKILEKQNSLGNDTKSECSNNENSSSSLQTDLWTLNHLVGNVFKPLKWEIEPASQPRGAMETIRLIVVTNENDNNQEVELKIFEDFRDSSTSRKAVKQRLATKALNHFRPYISS